MAHEREAREQRARGATTEEMTEETFLKDLYLFMKRRDTPIERIPHLGFKQIDLFVMYKTVNDSGGYHQVTAQQLWKQTYNTLGGNPRSTSAATCTRRHYEKLLLPYECHVKGGEFLSVLSHYNQHQLGGREPDDGPRPLKRRPLMLPLPQNSRGFLPSSHVRMVPVPVHYPHFYHPSHPVLTPYMPISPSLSTPPHGPQVSQVPQPQVSYLHPSTERSKEPLEHLRYLAEQYKSSSGLAEPLNLSVKGTGPGRESSSHPASSFTPPPASKNPKFLNQPSPLYPPKGVAKDEGCDTQDKDAALGKYSSVPPYPQYLRDGACHVIDLTSASASPFCSTTPDSGRSLGTASTSPVSLLCDRKVNPTTMTHIRSSRKRDFSDWPGEEKEENPRMRQRTVSHSLQAPPTPPGDIGDKMEIQIPLSVLQKWLKLCGTSRHGTFPLPIPTQQVDTRDRTSTSRHGTFPLPIPTQGVDTRDRTSTSRHGTFPLAIPTQGVDTRDRTSTSRHGTFPLPIPTQEVDTRDRTSTSRHGTFPLPIRTQEVDTRDRTSTSRHGTFPLPIPTQEVDTRDRTSTSRHGTFPLPIPTQEVDTRDRTSTNRHGTFSLPISTQEVDTRDGSSNSDISATRSNRAHLIFHSLGRDQDRGSAIDDLSPRQRNVTSPTSTTLFSTSDHHSTLSYHLPGYKPSMRSGGIFKGASGQDAYPLDEQDGSQAYYSDPTDGWDPYDRDCRAPLPVQLKRHSSPFALGRDDVGPKAPAYSPDASPSVVHLTREELLKLKRIISSSS